MFGLSKMLYLTAANSLTCGQSRLKVLRSLNFKAVFIVFYNNKKIFKLGNWKKNHILVYKLEF